MPPNRYNYSAFSPEDWANWAVQKKLQKKAHALINKAVQLGAIPAPHTLECVLCHKSAWVYHHPNGYTGKSALDVVAVCEPCHSKLHSNFPPRLNK